MLRANGEMRAGFIDAVNEDGQRMTIPFVQAVYLHKLTADIGSLHIIGGFLVG